jgi:transposase
MDAADALPQHQPNNQQNITEGWVANPLKTETGKKKHGRRKKTKSQNLLARLGDHESSVLAFLHDKKVPFTNNLAEQDIRMIKVRLKISRMLSHAARREKFRAYSKLHFYCQKTGM